MLCCVGSANRTIPNYVIHMWMATADQRLAATLYGPATVSALVGDRIPVKLTCRTTYPFEETIRVAVEPERSAAFPLYFRIPAWCCKPRITLNGTVQPAGADGKGFARIERTWTHGDVVELTFPMSACVERGTETKYPSEVRQGIGTNLPDSWFQERRLPFASVSYGPLLFALAIPDQDPSTPSPARLGSMPWTWRPIAAERTSRSSVVRCRRAGIGRWRPRCR